MARKKNPNSNPKSGGIGFAITALLLSSMTGFSLGGIIVGVVLGLGIGKITSIMGSGLDTTTHNKKDIERRQQEEEARRQQEEAEKRRLEELRRRQEEARRQEESRKIPLTGDAAADSVITRGQEMLATIRRENAAIPDEILSSQMDTLAEKCEQIFRTVSEAPAKAPQVRKFMDYYLPTTLKMLANFRTMQQRGVSMVELTQARDTTVRGMNMILTACQKQIDNLHRENMLDISTDIDVLEQMLKRDGYTENEIWGNKDLVTGARTAAEAQMRSSSAPVMHFPSETGTSETGSSSRGRHAGEN